MPAPNGPGPNRRQFLVRAAILAAAAPTLGAFAAACSKPPAPSRWRRRPQDRLADQPRQVGHPGGQSGDRRRARTGEGRDAQDLQLRRLPQPEGDQGLRGQVRVQDRGVDVQRRRRGDHQAAQRGRLRHLQRQLQRDGQAGVGRTAPPAQPHLHPGHQATSGRPSPTPGTTRAGSSRFRTPSTPPESVGAVTKCPRRSAS